MIAYASRTGTKRNLAALRAAGWRLLLSPTGVLRTEGFRYCLDNGAWTAHQQGTPWDADGFLAAVEKFGPDADFIVAPDIVEGGQDSLWLSLRYLVPIRRLAGPKPWILIPAQNGLGVREFHSYIHGGRIVKTGVFIGGSTEYKLAAIRLFGPWCKARDVWCHAGRVNSQRRIRLCANAGITSFDGSGPSRFAKHLDVLERELRQGCLFLPEVGL